MLSKCEQNEFFISRPKGYAGNFKAGNYFRQLKENLAQTEYYKEIILECGYFRKFIAENK
jgi:hypothetical protein